MQAVCVEFNYCRADPRPAEGIGRRLLYPDVYLALSDWRGARVHSTIRS